MTIYLCIFKLHLHRYMGSVEKGETDFRLVKAHDRDEAEYKLEQALGADRCEPGSDFLHLHIEAIHPMIE